MDVIAQLFHNPQKSQTHDPALHCYSIKKWLDIRIFTPKFIVRKKMKYSKYLLLSLFLCHFYWQFFSYFTQFHGKLRFQIKERLSPFLLINPNFSSLVRPNCNILRLIKPGNFSTILALLLEMTSKIANIASSISGLKII